MNTTVKNNKKKRNKKVKIIFRKVTFESFMNERCTEPQFKASIQRHWSNHCPPAPPTHPGSTSLSFYFFNFLVLLYFYLHFYNTYSASKLQSQLPPPTAFRSQRLHFSVCSSLLCKPFQNKGLRHGWKRFILFFMLVRCRTWEIAWLVNDIIKQCPQESD